MIKSHLLYQLSYKGRFCESKGCVFAWLVGFRAENWIAIGPPRQRW